MAAVENKLEIVVAAVDDEDQMDATEEVTDAGDAVVTAKKQKKKKKSKKPSKCCPVMQLTPPCPFALCVACLAHAAPRGVCLILNNR